MQMAHKAPGTTVARTEALPPANARRAKTHDMFKREQLLF
jgi:hypothetical protein